MTKQNGIRVISTLLILAGAILFSTSCTREKERKQGTDQLVLANFRDIRDLNPHLYGGELFAQNLLYESLIRLEHDGSFSPWLAESYSVSEDGLEYTFQLRKDVVFHDGVKFNADTAKANFDAILDNSARHFWLDSVPLMIAVDNAGGQSVEKTGEYEIVLRLAEPYYPFLIELGFTRPFRFVSPDSFIDGTTKNGVSTYYGTGSYQLKENVVDEYAVFERFEDYWGAEPAIQSIMVKVIPDASTRAIALENGEVDLIYGTDLVSTETYRKFENLGGFGSLMSQPLATRMLLFNTNRDITGDRLVRQAIMHSVDRETISRVFFDNIETPADTLLAPSVPYADIGLEPYNYNPEKAEALLDQAGWIKSEGSGYRSKNGQELEFTLNYNTNSVNDKTISEYLQQELSRIGVNLEIRGEEQNAFIDRIRNGDFNLTFYTSWGTPYDPQSFIAAMKSPAYGDYIAQLGLDNKEELDQNIIDALKSTDPVKRARHYAYILETLHEEAVYLPLTYERNRAVFSDQVKNVTFNPSKFEIPLERMELE